MREDKASYTAEIAALCRAIESAKPEHERVCYDPLAKYFLPPSFLPLLSNIRPLARFLVWFTVDRVWPGDLGTVAARTRFIDDYLRSCVQKGIRQLVILGAGHDSRAYRIEEVKGGVMVFEVDHPATQRAKKEKVKKIFGSLPEHVVYVPVDFMKEKLEQRLPENGYDRDSTTLFIWEGVTMYITAEAVDKTLAFVASNSGEGSSIVFDYVQYSDRYEPRQRDLLKRSQVHLRRRGEPWTFGIREGSVQEFLTNRGFHQVVNAGTRELKEAYFKGRNQNRTLYDFLPVVRAEVKPRA